MKSCLDTLKVSVFFKRKSPSHWKNYDLYFLTARKPCHSSFIRDLIIIADCKDISSSVKKKAKAIADLVKNNRKERSSFFKSQKAYLDKRKQKKSQVSNNHEQVDNENEDDSQDSDNGNYRNDEGDNKNNDESNKDNDGDDMAYNQENYNNFEPDTGRSWILRSGTNVGEALKKYVETIPETQKCLNLAYWNIIDLTEDSMIKHFFSVDDWEEITESFKNDVTLIESDIPDVVITKKENNNAIKEIAKLSPEIIERNNNIILTDEDEDIMDNIKLATITYIENLKGLGSLISERDFDNNFPTMLTKRFLENQDLQMDANEGLSIYHRARAGQKCDFRGTLKNSHTSLEAIIGLRSGGLPVAHRKKILEDRIDLAVVMRDILYDFFKSNLNAPGDELHRTYVLGIQSWEWIHETYGMDCKATNVLRFGRLSQTRMPNNPKTLTTLEEFYAL
ncbi:18201_t:CDS:2, partial [Acaulospora morrowiae]